jgi:hypothetical protein
MLARRTGAAAFLRSMRYTLKVFDIVGRCIRNDVLLHVTLHAMAL